MAANFATGQRLTAAALNAAINRHEPIESVLAVQETRPNTIVMQDSALALALAANTVYDVTFKGLITGPTAADFKNEFSYPAGASVLVLSVAAASTAPGFDTPANMAAFVADPTSPSNSVAGGTVSLTDAVPVQQWLRVVMGANAGTLRMRWAQLAANATATVLHPGSKLRAYQTSANG